MALSDLAIRTAKPGAKPIRLSDSGGLYLEVAPSGGKLWRLKYRFGGKEKRLALGKYPDVGLKEARERRDEARKLLANEVDPGENRKQQKAARAERAANSFEAVAREWIARNTPTWAATHTSKIVRRLEMYVFPWLGGRPIAEITAPELLAMARRIEGKGAIETAHRAMQNCGQIFRYAVATGRAERDPTGDLRGALQPVTSKHMAAVTEPHKVAELLRTFDTYQGTLTVRCALQLAPLVFVRPGELRQAKWKDIDLDAAEWRYIASKKGNAHIVPLALQAVAILREVQALTGGGLYVFPSARTSERPMSDNAILAAMRRLGIAKDEMSGHGFRAMARTILDEVLGFRPDLIEHQLAHAVRDPNGRAYNRTAHLSDRRKMMQSWADYLDELKAGAEVIPIHGHTAA
ncbi:tyrosine-type recombinase/integrase [Thiobacillus thioparus]|uniref:tyrosine-type recombinase/integrase n=1 Tax=Thiobacillus thioparus TaxID=931 RepID=UPI00037707DD|nr:integrase arm-type DNA-binding domain-containing protein [Thiobacillus thioparus]